MRVFELLGPSSWVKGWNQETALGGSVIQQPSVLLGLTADDCVSPKLQSVGDYPVTLNLLQA